MLASFSVVPMGAGVGVKEIVAEALANDEDRLAVAVAVRVRVRDVGRE